MRKKNCKENFEQMAHRNPPAAEKTNPTNAFKKALKRNKEKKEKRKNTSNIYQN